MKRSQKTFRNVKSERKWRGGSTDASARVLRRNVIGTSVLTNPRGMATKRIAMLSSTTRKKSRKMAPRLDPLQAQAPAEIRRDARKQSNVSVDGEVYETAKSRRVRARTVLEQSGNQESAVALGASRNTSTSNATSATKRSGTLPNVKALENEFEHKAFVRQAHTTHGLKRKQQQQQQQQNQPEIAVISKKASRLIKAWSDRQNQSSSRPQRQLVVADKIVSTMQKGEERHRPRASNQSQHRSQTCTESEPQKQPQKKSPIITNKITSERQEMEDASNRSHRRWYPGSQPTKQPRKKSPIITKKITAEKQEMEDASNRSHRRWYPESQPTKQPRKKSPIITKKITAEKQEMEDASNRSHRRWYPESQPTKQPRKKSPITTKKIMSERQGMEETSNRSHRRFYPESESRTQPRKQSPTITKKVNSERQETIEDRRQKQSSRSNCRLPPSTERMELSTGIPGSRVQNVTLAPPRQIPPEPQPVVANTINTMKRKEDERDNEPKFQNSSARKSNETSVTVPEYESQPQQKRRHMPLAPQLQRQAPMKRVTGFDSASTASDTKPSATIIDLLSDSDNDDDIDENDAVLALTQLLQEEVIAHRAVRKEMEGYARNLFELGLHSKEMILDVFDLNLIDGDDDSKIMDMASEIVKGWKWMKKYHGEKFLEWVCDQQKHSLPSIKK